MELINIEHDALIANLVCGDGGGVHAEHGEHEADQDAQAEDSSEEDDNDHDVVAANVLAHRQQHRRHKHHAGRHHRHCVEHAGQEVHKSEIKVLFNHVCLLYCHISNL